MRSRSFPIPLRVDIDAFHAEGATVGQSLIFSRAFHPKAASHLSWTTPTSLTLRRATSLPRCPS